MGEQQEKQLVQIFILTKLWLDIKYIPSHPEILQASREHKHPLSFYIINCQSYTVQLAEHWTLSAHSSGPYHPLPPSTALWVHVGRSRSGHMEHISQRKVFLSYIEGHSRSPAGVCHKTETKWGCFSTVWSQGMWMDVHPVLLQSGIEFLRAGSTFSCLQIPEVFSVEVQGCATKGEHEPKMFYYPYPIKGQPELLPQCYNVSRNLIENIQKGY